MTSLPIRIALAQINPTVGAIEANADLIIDTAQHVYQQLQADLIVFTELAVTGYPPEDLLLRSDMYPRVGAALQKIQQATAGINLIVGAPLRDDEHTYNAAVLLQADGHQQNYYKSELPNYGVFDEKRHFNAGERPLVFHINGIGIGITVCEDIWFPHATAASCSAGAQVIVSLNASPFNLENRQQREEELQARATENNVPIIYVNQIGGQDEIVFDGYSLVVDGQGQSVLRLPQFEVATGAVNIDEKGVISAITPSAAAPQTPLDTIYKALVCGVRDYVGKNGFAGALLGLSGGIDSALTLAIAVDALGADKVHAVMMPFDYTSQMSQDDAAEQAQTLGVHYSVIPIKQPYNAFVELLKEEFSDNTADATEENIQARCRGLLLMAISNKKHRILLTTGNKSEMAVGYATLYGDMAGGFAPIKDVPKTLVYQLAEYRNKQAGEIIIPQRVIDRPPSAELAPDQVDQDSLPPYDVLDEVLERYIEDDWSIDQISASGFDRELVTRIVKMVVRNEYKRRQAPPGVRVSKRAFGRDRRYPITSGYENTRYIKTHGCPINNP